MTEIKQQALAKMLEEMNQAHEPAADTVHNWLCEQDDDELFQGVLKDGYTIKMALKYAKEKAREFAINGVACIDDETVFGWVKEYFLANNSLENIKQVPVESVKRSKVNQPALEPEGTKPAKKSKKKAPVVVGQLNLFEDMVYES